MPSTDHAAQERATDLYLDLLKRSLTNTLFSVEPSTSQPNEFRFVSEFVKHYINAPAVSMLPLSRLDNIHACIQHVLKDNIPGDLIETGVWRGGAVIFMRAILKLYGVEDRMVWAADSFEGLPEPDAEKFPREAKAYQGPAMKDAMKHLAASLPDVKRNFEAYGMLDDKVTFLQGWFCNTLPTAPIKTLSIMRLDGDFYESTMDGLTNLYDKLSVGGFAIIDDYGEEKWTYCREAVEEFRQKRDISDEMIRVDSRCYYWRKSKA